MTNEATRSARRILGSGRHIGEWNAAPYDYGRWPVLVPSHMRVFAFPSAETPAHSTFVVPRWLEVAGLENDHVLFSAGHYALETQITSMSLADGSLTTGDWELAVPYSGVRGGWLEDSNDDFVLRDDTGRVVREIESPGEEASQRFEYENGDLGFSCKRDEKRTIVCLDQLGRERWATTFSNRDIGFGTPSLVVGDVHYLLLPEGLLAFDVTNGRELWSKPMRGYGPYVKITHDGIFTYADGMLVHVPLHPDQSLREVPVRDSAMLKDRRLFTRVGGVAILGVTHDDMALVVDTASGETVGRLRPAANGSLQTARPTGSDWTGVGSWRLSLHSSGNLLENETFQIDFVREADLRGDLMLPEGKTLPYEIARFGKSTRGHYELSIASGDFMSTWEAVEVQAFALVMGERRERGRLGKLVVKVDGAELSAEEGERIESMVDALAEIFTHVAPLSDLRKWEVEIYVTR